MNKEEFELSINMSDEEIEKIKNILCASRGVRHYLLKIDNDEELDVVEYKEYQKLEQENQQLKEKISLLNTMNENNYNKYCDLLKEKQELRSWLEELGNCDIYTSEVISKLNELENKNF